MNIQYKILEFTHCLNYRILSRIFRFNNYRINYFLDNIVVKNRNIKIEGALIETKIIVIFRKYTYKVIEYITILVENSMVIYSMTFSFHKTFQRFQRVPTIYFTTGSILLFKNIYTIT